MAIIELFTYGFDFFFLSSGKLWNSLGWKRYLNVLPKDLLCCCMLEMKENPLELVLNWEGHLLFTVFLFSFYFSVLLRHLYKSV